MNVYYCGLSGGADYEDALPFMSEQRAGYCERIKAPALRKQSAFSYLLMRYALKTEYGITEAPIFVYGERGKPMLRDIGGVFFSMSHCRTAVVCAVHDAPVGADVQNVRRLRLSVAGRFCTDGELERVNALPESEKIGFLCRLWSVKESVGKMTGNGFAEGFCGIDTEKLISEGRAAVTVYGGNFVSVCARDGVDGITVREVGEELLLL